MKEKFEYNYTAPTKEVRDEVENIKNQYLEIDSNDDLTKLRKLNNKVKSIPTVWAICFGIIGTLCFGAGLAFFLELTAYWYFGIPCAIIGIILIALAYPIYSKIHSKVKQKYKDEIIELSNKILNDK